MMHAVLTIGLTLLIVGSLVVLYVRRDKTAAKIDADESARWFQTVKALPETTAFDPKPDVVRARLRVISSPRLKLVPDADDIDWVFAADLFPQQRDGRGL